MSSFNFFKEALKRYLEPKVGVKEVTGFYDYAQTTGGCETCEYTEYLVDIYYLDLEGKSCVYTYDGNFSLLIEELTNIS